MPEIAEPLSITTHINPSITLLGEKFTQLEPDSITLEEGDLLYALVRMRKPKLTIETGTGWGMATRHICKAIARNGGEGRFISCDTDSECVGSARRLIRWPTFLEVRQCTGLDLLRSLKEKPEFIFVDAGNAENRFREVTQILHQDLLAPRGILVIHDALNGKHKDLIKRMIRISPQWPGVVMESLAGIAIFQRP